MNNPAEDERFLARVGTTVRGKYRIDALIGIGGMAAVYAATHRNQAEFALKMLHPEISTRGDVRARFLREGYAANSVKHPGVVQVVDDDVADDGAVFLVMERLHGAGIEDLWEKNGGRLPLSLAIAIVDQLLEVLDAAHAKGIIHRDIKPANLFLIRDGSVKVLDFGIARARDALQGDGAQTGTGMVLGTPAFMAPEQAMGKATEIDARTDLWAAGATLFSLLSGEFVHDGENASQLFVRAATQPARKLVTLSPDTHPAVAAVVDRALAFDRAQRWHSAKEMREALVAAHVAIFGALPSRESLIALLPGGSRASLPSAPPSLVRGTEAAAWQTPAPRPSLPSAESMTPRPIANSYTHPATPRRSILPWLIAGGVFFFALALVAVVVAIGFFRARKVVAVASPLQPSVESPVPPVVPVASAAPAPVASVMALPDPAPRESAGTAESPRAAAPSASSRAPLPWGSATAPRPKLPTANCNPPYYVNANGDKVFKKDCL